MITDKSGLSKVGLALLRKNLGKLTPVKSIELKRRGEQQVVIVNGPGDTFESNSFGWGHEDERTKALAEAAKALGWPLPVEELQKIPFDGSTFIRSEERLINEW